MGSALMWSINAFSRNAAQSVKMWNISLNLPELKAGDNLTRRFFHLMPPMEKRWAAVQEIKNRITFKYLSSHMKSKNYQIIETIKL